MTEPRNNALTTRGKPFQPGNPGKPKGARHKTTLALDTLLDGEAGDLMKLLDSFMSVLQATDFEERIAALEQARTG